MFTHCLYFDLPCGLAKIPQWYHVNKDTLLWFSAQFLLFSTWISKGYIISIIWGWNSDLLKWRWSWGGGGRIEFTERHLFTNNMSLSANVVCWLCIFFVLDSFCLATFTLSQTFVCKHVQGFHKLLYITVVVLRILYIGINISYLVFLALRSVHTGCRFSSVLVQYPSCVSCLPHASCQCWESHR